MIIKCKTRNNYELFSFLCIKLSKGFNPKTTKRTNTVSSRVTLLMREAEETSSANQDEIIFNKRSLSSYQKRDSKENKSTNESINFNTEVNCDYCNNSNDLNFLLLLEKKSDSIDAVWSCLKCQQRIKPKLKVQINQEKIESFEVLTPFDLFLSCRCKFMTNNQNKIDIESFKKKYISVFYNCLLYFSMRNLSFDFLIPYQNKIQYQQDEVIDERNAFSNLEIASNPAEIIIDSSSSEALNTLKIRPMRSNFIFKKRVKKKENKSVDYDSLRLNQIKMNVNNETHPSKEKSERKFTLDFNL